MLQVVLDLARSARESRPTLHLLVGRVDDALGLVVVVQEGEQPVVLFLRDRVELVVVALGTLDRQAEDALAEASMRSNIASMRNCSGSMPPSSLIIELRRKPVATIWSCVAFGSRSPANLLDDELVVGQVAVERVDDPVAVEPDLARLVLLVAVAVGVAGRVEPVPRPALAVVRRGEQPVDQLLVGVAGSCRRGRRRPPRASAAGRSGRGRAGGRA